MKRIAITLVLGSLFAACATDESTVPVGIGGAAEGKPSPVEFAQPERAYQGEAGAWSETLPELPSVVLLHERARVAVLAEDGTELCSLVHQSMGGLTATEVIDACGELQR
jgi:hypothetical protein